jgi:hypothetical protein
MLVFASPVAVGGIAGVAFEKEQLTDSFVGIDAAICPGTVAEFKR